MKILQTFTGMSKRVKFEKLPPAFANLWAKEADEKLRSGPVCTHASVKEHGVLEPNLVIFETAVDGSSV